MALSPTEELHWACLLFENDEKGTDSRTSASSQVLRGERVCESKVRTLSALYRPTFEKYPTFPSIYQTKYQRDFQYIKFPVDQNYKPSEHKSNYSGFKFGNSTYNNTFATNERQQPRRNPLPCSQNRMHNPQPSMRLVQNYPNQVRWIWTALEQNKQRVSNNLASHGGKHHDTRYHRWNSR